MESDKLQFVAGSWLGSPTNFSLSKVFREAVFWSSVTDNATN